MDSKLSDLIWGLSGHPWSHDDTMTLSAIVFCSLTHERLGCNSSIFAALFGVFFTEYSVVKSYSQCSQSFQMGKVVSFTVHFLTTLLHTHTHTHTHTTILLDPKQAQRRHTHAVGKCLTIAKALCYISTLLHLCWWEVKAGWGEVGGWGRGLALPCGSGLWHWAHCSFHHRDFFSQHWGGRGDWKRGGERGSIGGVANIEDIREMLQLLCWPPHSF